MGKFKIIFTVCLTVLSLHVRESQLRSLEDDKSGDIISRVGNIEDWNTKECVCFPKTDTGTLVSQYFPFGDDQERLVVYFYKSKLSNELKAYIPSWKKQTFFPDLTFDFGDKFESTASEGISDLFSSAYYTKTLEAGDVIPVSTVIPHGKGTVNLTSVPDLEIINVPTSDNQYENYNGALPTDFDPISLVHILPDEVNAPDKTYKKQPENNNEAWYKDFNPMTVVEGPPDELTIPSNAFESKQEIDSGGWPKDFNPINYLEHIFPHEINVPDKTYENQHEEHNEAWPKDINPITSMDGLLDELTIPSNTYIIEQENDNMASPKGFNLSNLVKGPLDELNQQENDNGALSKGFDLSTLVMGPPDELTIPNKTYKNQEENDNGSLPKSLKLINLVKDFPDEIKIYENLEKPGAEGETTLITSPENPIQLPYNNQNENFNSPLGQQNHPMKGTLIDTNGSNMPIHALPGLGGLLKYIPGYVGVLAPLKSHEAGLIDMTAPSRPSNSVNNEYLPSKYERPTFNNWLNKQMTRVLSNRPFMSNAINFHSLRILLIKALYENGIHLSRDGNLYDSNGNVLRMANLKLRPILLGDPMEYEKLIANKKCVIPYDIPYLEAVLVTLVYPPRILAIIPLGLRNDFMASSQGKIIPNLCGQSTCHSCLAFRSGLPKKEESTNDLNKKIFNKENNEPFYIPEDPAEDSNNIGVQNNTPYIMSANTDLPMEVSSTPEAVIIPKHFLENEESKSNRRAYNAEELNEENYGKVHELSRQSIEELEPIYSNDDGISNYSANVDVNPGNQRTLGGENIYFDKGNYEEGRKSLQDFDLPQEPEQKPEEDDYEMLTTRIVGGNPATSSGTPVSSRGRSGWGP